MFKYIALVFALFAMPFAAHAQQFYSNVKASRISTYHTTVGTSTAAAIPSASVGGNLISFKICNDAVNTSTYLLVGLAVDVSTDGLMLDKGQCYECPNCSAAILKLLKVEAQAASNGYSVVQYRN